MNVVNRQMNMNRRVCIILAVLTAITAAALQGCVREGDRQVGRIPNSDGIDDKADKKGGLAPLVVDKDAPLLLSETKESYTGASTQAAVANAACFVCHSNYEAEPLVRRHIAANVGCADCHGKSYAHRNDENNITPPDIMYPREKIEQMCGKCHIRHDISAARITALLQQRRQDKEEPREIVCTDCHGSHRLKLRSVRWDKRSGELIPVVESR